MMIVVRFWFQSVIVNVLAFKYYMEKASPFYFVMIKMMFYEILVVAGIDLGDI